MKIYMYLLFVLFLVGCPNPYVQIDFSSYLKDFEDDANGRDANGNTPLIWAAKQGYPHIVQALIDKNVEVNARNNRGWTALKYANQREDRYIANLLKKAGAKEIKEELS